MKEQLQTLPLRRGNAEKNKEKNSVSLCLRGLNVFRDCFLSTRITLISRILTDKSLKKSVFARVIRQTRVQESTMLFLKAEA